MGLKPLVAILLLTALAMAGCSGKKNDDGTAPDASTSLSSTATTTALPNRAPTGALNASLTNGSAPLAVEFSLEGSDADGDGLNWTLQFGDGGNQTNGTALPATVSHNYTLAGNFSAVFTLTDSEERVSYNVTVTVTGGAEVPSGEPIVIEFSTSLPCPDCFYVTDGTAACIELNAGEEIRCDAEELPPEAPGRAFTLTGGSDPDIEFFDTCGGTSLEWFSNEGPEESGVVPAGAGCAVVYDFVADGASMTLTIT